MRKFKFIYIVVFLVWSSASKAQQTPQFSTYMFNHFSINPAYCGSKQTLNLNTVQRYQWLNFSDGAPRSQMVNVQYSNKQRKVGLGLSLMNDQIGASQNQSALFTYAYHLKMPVGRLAMGVRAGVQSLGVDFNKVHYEDKADTYTGTMVRRIAPTGDFGLYYYTSDFYTSLALNNMWGARLTSFRNAANFTRLYPHLFFTAGKAFVVNPDLIINPSIMVKKVQAAPLTIDLNCNFRIGERFWTGLSYREKSSVVILAQIGITDRLRFGYSYDIGVNGIGTVSGATHEFYLGFDVNVHNNKIISTRYL
ncbi:MAG: type IX secretion system membrane protein PorP/SprF [Bacteroidia bacterium]|nr:type IX secretion system membrane protein PorP/SprF [Bacteroidia bacterium]